MVGDADAAAATANAVVARRSTELAGSQPAIGRGHAGKRGGGGGR